MRRNSLKSEQQLGQLYMLLLLSYSHALMNWPPLVDSSILIQSLSIALWWPTGMHHKIPPGKRGSSILFYLPFYLTLTPVENSIFLQRVCFSSASFNFDIQGKNWKQPEVQCKMMLSWCSTLYLLISYIPFLLCFILCQKVPSKKVCTLRLKRCVPFYLDQFINKTMAH